MAKNKEQFWEEVWNIITGTLAKISHTSEDEKMFRKIWKFYQHKRNVAGGQLKTLAVGILYAYARVNFLNFEKKPWQQKNIA